VKRGYKDNLPFAEIFCDPADNLLTMAISPCVFFILFMPETDGRARIRDH